ncbi:MAG TPA: hypothetical protein DD670_06050 [Planctomycetaceae bacterium]|nr:hypothetical protein [Planctomycetaceae bacterium]
MPRAAPVPSITPSNGGSGIWWIVAGAVVVFYWMRRRKARNQEQRLEASSGRVARPRDYDVSVRRERVRSKHPSLVVELVVDDDFSPTPRQRRTENTEWIPANSSKQLAGFEIGGMIYVGNPQCATAYWRNENCVIDPSAEVSRSQADYTGGRMPYWPCYAEIDPMCRRAYLEWLAGGRSDPGTYIGYVFLYFYGLERRLIVDAPGDEETQALFDEVERLREIYGANGSFNRYSKALLDCRPVLIKDPTIIEPSLERERSWELPLPVKLGVGNLIARGEPVSAGWMLSWWLAHPDTRLRTPAKRAPDEFRELFLSRFRKRYPNGLQCRPPKASLSHCYRAASGTFEKEFDDKLRDIPDISRLKQPLGIADNIAAECMDSLDAFSRYLGRNPNGRGSLEAAALLPEEIRTNMANPALDALKQWVEEAKNAGPLNVEDLVEHVTGDSSDRISRGMLSKASGILAAVGTGFSPDPAYALMNPKRGDRVVLFDVGQEDPPSEAEKKEFQAALLMLILGAIVAHADGRVDPAERQQLLGHIQSARNLSEAHKARLWANLDWLLDSPPELRTIKRHFAALGNDEKTAVGRLLIAIAGADGGIDPSEVAAIEKIFDGLGLPAESVYSELHSLAVVTPSDEPITVHPESRGRGGYAIPQPPAVRSEGETNRIVLDQSRIAAIMAETSKVSDTLASIFGEPEEQASETSEDVNEADEIFLGPDSKHDALIRELLTRSQWAADEFSQLAKRFDLMPGGALEAINEWSFEVHEELLIEGDEVLEINPAIAALIEPAERGAEL